MKLGPSKLWSVTAVAIVLVAVLDCSGSGSNGGASCSTNGSCPNSPPPTASDISKCERLVGDAKCGTSFQTYFNCALAQEKCTPAGVTDDAATKTAITMNCAGVAAAYQSCAGTSSTTTMCGLGGLACCTDGSPPCASTGCCDPATNKCRGLGEACTAGGTVCGGNQCTACGAPGQPCCTLFNVTQPMPCPGGGCCNYANGQAGAMCIAEGGQCDAPGPMTTETVCRSNSCITCGGDFGMCCAGNKCTAPNVCSANSTCMPSGAGN